MTQLLPPKKEVALALLEKSNVDVYLDPRSQGVVVPPQFRKEPRLILKIGLNMPVPIPDLRLDDESMSCTLSFNRTKFFCVVPWSSVFAMVGDDGRGMVWPDDVPQELAEQQQRRPPGPGEAPAPAPSSRGTAPARGPKPRLAAESAPDAGRGGKRPKKKKDDAQRPLLVALPAPPPSRPAPRGETGQTAESAAKVEAAPAAPRSEPAAPEKTAASEAEAAKAPELSSPAVARPTGSSSPRPKRELPPYLRVVK